MNGEDVINKIENNYEKKNNLPNPHLSCLLSDFNQRPISNCISNKMRQASYYPSLENLYKFAKCIIISDDTTIGGSGYMYRVVALSRLVGNGNDGANINNARVFRHHTCTKTIQLNQLSFPLTLCLVVVAEPIG